MSYDPAYPTVLPPLIALALILVLNIAAPILAFLRARAVQRRKWLPHALGFLWVLTSPLTFGLLAMPTLSPDEEPGPGAGFAFLPILTEIPIVLIAHIVALGLALLIHLSEKSPSNKTAIETENEQE